MRCSPSDAILPPQGEINSYSSDVEMHPGWTTMKPGEMRNSKGLPGSSQCEETLPQTLEHPELFTVW